MEIESQFRMAIRDALNLQSRKPFFWGGLKGYHQLEAISQGLHELPDAQPFFQRLIRQVDRAVDKNRSLANELEIAHSWLLRLATCLRYPPSSHDSTRISSEQVEHDVQDLLRQLAVEAGGKVVPMALYSGLQYRWQLFGRDLLHCYDIPGLPQDNLHLESLFGRLRRRQRRISGRKSTKELRDFGQCQVLFMAASQEQLLDCIQLVPQSDYLEHRKRLAQAEKPRQFLQRLHRDPTKTMRSLVQRYSTRLAELTAPSALHTD